MTGADELREVLGALDPAATVTVAAYVVLALALAVEGLVALDRIGDPRRAATRAAALVVTIAGASALSLPVAAVLAGLWGLLRHLAPVPVTDWWASHRGVELIVCFLVWDLAAYAYHRVGHRSRVGWASHRVHHLGQSYDMGLVLRQPWLPVHGLVVLPWLAVAGLSFEAAAVCSTLSLTYQALQHTSGEWRWPRPMEAVLVSGRAHRHHHLVDGGGVNLGAVLSVWDRLFGTHRAGPVGEAPRFGVGSPEPLNPLRNQVDGWRELLRRPPVPLHQATVPLAASAAISASAKPFSRSTASVSTPG